MFLLTNIDFQDKNTKYKEGEPGIEVIEFVADTLKLPKQPHLVSMILLSYRSVTD